MLLQIREEKKDTPHGKNTRYGIVRDSPPPWNRSHVVVFAHALGIIPTISIVAAQCPALPVHGKFARPDNEEMTKQQLFHFRALKKKKLGSDHHGKSFVREHRDFCSVGIILM